MFYIDLITCEDHTVILRFTGTALYCVVHTGTYLYSNQLFVDRSQCATYHRRPDCLVL